MVQHLWVRSILPSRRTRIHRPLLDMALKTGIRSELSSAYFSPSNGRCEKSVRQIKTPMSKFKATRECFFTALAEWKLAPHSDGPSPSQLFFRRQVRSGNLPEIHGPLDIQKAIQEKEDCQRKYRAGHTAQHPRQPMALHQDVCCKIETQNNGL